MALGLDPSQIRPGPGEPWSGAAVAVMELSMDGAIASVVAVADGSVSLYLSTGGGVIGAGEHVAVRAEGQRFRTVVADARGMLVRTAESPLPRAGEVRFHAWIGQIDSPASRRRPCCGPGATPSRRCTPPARIC